MTEGNNQIALASKLPLKDAAYLLLRFSAGPFRSLSSVQEPALQLLKSAHLNTERDTLERAICSAIKFDQDCGKFFEYKSKNYLDDVSIAVNRSAKENPGFTEPTISTALTLLAYQMR